MHDASLPPPDYEELTAALRAAGVALSAAEVHGVLTAAVSVPQARAPGRILFGDKPPAPGPELEFLLRQIAALQEDIRLRLEGTDFEFRPLLPADASLPDEVDALASWARGYVLGLAAAGVREPNRLRG